MADWFYQVFTSKEFWISFCVAGSFLVFGKTSAVMWRLFRYVRQSHQSYTVSGFWIGTCILPSYGGKPHIEIWRLTQSQENVALSFFCYPPDETTIEHCAGAGIFRGANLSALYYSTLRGAYDSGVLVLRLKAQRLIGSYAQFDPKDQEEVFFASDTSYSLTRVQLSLWQATRMFLGFKPLPTYLAAKTLYDAVAHTDDIANKTPVIEPEIVVEEAR